MGYPHFSYPATVLSFVLAAVGAITGFELFFLLGITLSAVTLMVVLVQGNRDRGEQ